MTSNILNILDCECFSGLIIVVRLRKQRILLNLYIYLSSSSKFDNRLRTEENRSQIATWRINTINCINFCIFVKANS